MSAWDVYAEARKRIASGAWIVDVEAGTIHNREGRELGTIRSNGYRYVCLRMNGARRNAMAHRVVYEHATGEPLPPDLVVDHVNAIKTDNRFANLEAVTNEENLRRARAMGLTAAYTLTHRDVEVIRHAYAMGGWTYKELGRVFGVGFSAIGYIVRRDVYRDVA